MDEAQAGERAHDHLGEYLDDHWAGAGGGANLARRLHQHNADTAWADRLAWVAAQVRDDDETLRRIRETLDQSGGELKRSASKVGELLTRVQQNATSYTPLSRVLEIEAMIAGVAGKERLWSALRVSMDGVPPLEAFDFAALQASAHAQLDALRSFHDQAAAIAFQGAEESILAPGD